MDPDTRAAIARFQEQNGLRRTERLDEATLARLNSSSQTENSGSSAAATVPSTASSAPNQSTQPMPEGAGNSGPTAQPSQQR
jgi:peptidoglycan hydrolase-like protein with peptidoglycan-binding domain